MRHSHPYATQFRLLAGVCFLCMLPVALIARASNWRWRPWPPGREGYRSVYQEALTNAKTAAAIALSV
ncbi:MAG: hypothetical protein AAGA84_02750 [Pseudomonadota bacterium]